MGAHIFVVSEQNFEKSLDNGVHAIGPENLESPRRRSQNAEMIAGMESIKSGDFVFFYVTNRGVHGLWKANSQAFLDEQIDIWGEPGRYPYAVTFEPVMRAFHKPIALNDIHDLRDRGRIWTFDLGTMARKNHHGITTEEARELVRLLLRNNPIAFPPDPIKHPYIPTATPLPLSLSTVGKGQLQYEGYLSAWFMRQFVRGELKDRIGEYQDFLNFVPTSFDKEMDIFLTHVTNVDGIAVLHKFTCMELKTPVATEDDLNQLVRYEDWIARKLANGDHEMVQSILVASGFRTEALDYVRKRKRIDEKTVRLVQYVVNETHNDIRLEEVE